MREMKDSGIEWIGEIPQEWIYCKLKNVVKISSGEAISKEEYTDTGYEIIGANGVIGYCDKFNNTNQVITTGRVGTIGTTHIYEKSWITDNVLIIETKDIINIDYLCNVIPNFDFKQMTSGTAMPLITATKLSNIYIPMPPFEEQVRIATHLDIECAKIDDVITKTKTTIEEYKKLKQSVITEAVTKGIRPNREMKDSGSVWFNDIPSDWNCQKLKFVFHIQKDIAGEEGYTVLSITQKGIIPKDLSKNEGQLAQNYSNYQFVHIGDFAMNHMDLLTGWVDISKYEGVTSPDYRVFVLNNAENNSKNYYLYMMQMCYSNKIFYGLGQGVSGFGRWRLQADKFLNFYIPIPPYEEQQEIADYLDKKCSEIDTLIAKKEQIAAELENYKKSVIYEYVTGKREVSDMNEKEETITIFDPQAARRMQMALAYKVIKQSGNDLKGRIHLMKIIYMLDCMLGLGLGINYLRYTRGPYNPIIESIEKNLSDKGIISVNTAKNYSYTVIDDSFDSKYNELFAKHNSEIEKIIDYMKRMKSSRAEKIATLYAAWNDMVIDGVQNITDKMIIDDVMNNWTENKAKTDFSTWRHILNDMKDKKIIPHGYGKHTRPRSE